ncbi:MAG: 2-C-methyl-D-erythritol 2,4-cyclodiphosphate synthase [Treponema sp.]|nr:2-C-methyl-D-erythritol 2,4-cyclodiphosphate synthase [Treponema sp.]MEE3435080.1 2-C-methyl-D-erythritol 2,4-cyclodiphosphate synthase [Treponema sp.]
MTTRTTTSIKKQGPQAAAFVLVAAGSSQRMGELGKKEYLPLNGGSVLSEAALVFLKTKLFSTAVVVHPKNGLAAAKKAFFKNPLVAELTQGSNVIFTPGGKTRQESVFNALKALDKACKKPQAQKPPRLVLIHDGARPFISQSLVKKTVAATLKYGAAVPALQPVETQKEMDSSSRIARHLKRSSLAAVQTPQGFLFPEILDCHKKAFKDQKAAAAGHSAQTQTFTDDTEIWDNYSGKKTRVIPGEPGNIKITYPKDVTAGLDCQRSQERSEIISSSKISEATYRSYQKAAAPTVFRVGLGTDLHRLTTGRKLILGGVVIPHALGEDGHSDGDALLHAITDALLGAAALGDIGSYFPPEDNKWKGADSAKLLQAAWKDVRAAGWKLQNLDCVVKLQEPKFLPHRQKVRQSIARILGVSAEQVFVKAKTGERVGPVGLCQAVETEAICLLCKG